MIRIAETQDHDLIAQLYKVFFPKHNVFSASEDIIKTYLATQVDQLLVLEDDGKIVGATYVVLTGTDITKTHKVWKFRHFAFSDDAYSSKLLAAAENHIKGLSKTVKIELTIAESENTTSFYLANGYEKEGSLTNHYRWGETCFLLGKSIGSQNCELK